jgi:hypothetical protein
VTVAPKSIALHRLAGGKAGQIDQDIGGVS